jgi:hypothetical protein
MGESAESAESGESDDAEPSDKMRERADESRLKLWLLLDANRWLIAGLFLLISFVSLVVLGKLDPAPLRAAVRSGDPIETLFQGFLTAIITGVTLVVTINQLVLSQELGPLGDQQDRMAGAMAFRENIEDDLDVPASPPEPSAFLRMLVDSVSSSADELQERTDESDDGAADRVHAYAEDLSEHASSVSDRLDGTQFGTFDLLFVALDFNYSWKIYEGRRLRATNADDLSEDARETLDRLLETLRHFGPAREHFKTLYFQWELIDLSRAMLYTAVPALVVTMGMILYVDNAATVTGSTLGIDNLVWTASAAATVALAPFAILLSIVLRVATVAKRTLSIGPFILRRADREQDLDWE